MATWFWVAGPQLKVGCSEGSRGLSGPTPSRLAFARVIKSMSFRLIKPGLNPSSLDLSKSMTTEMTLNVSQLLYLQSRGDHSTCFIAFGISDELRSFVELLAYTDVHKIVPVLTMIISP